MNRRIHFSLFLLMLFVSVMQAQSITPAINGNNQDQIKAVEEIKIFPNPAVDYIQITNNAVVKKIVILTIFSKEVKSFQHYNNAQHDISELKPGVYIIKMIDDKNKVLRAVRFSKNYDGV